jgi:hypothetical protein
MRGAFPRLAHGTVGAGVWPASASVSRLPKTLVGRRKCCVLAEPVGSPIVGLSRKETEPGATATPWMVVASALRQFVPFGYKPMTIRGRRRKRLAYLMPATVEDVNRKRRPRWCPCPPPGAPELAAGGDLRPGMARMALARVSAG